MRVWADAEQQHVESWSAGPVLGLGGGAQRPGVPVGGCLWVSSIWAVRTGHRMDPVGRNTDVVEQHTAGAGLVALRITGGQEPLVAPPDLDPAPVHGVPSRRGRQFGQHLSADAAAGQYQAGLALCGYRVD